MSLFHRLRKPIAPGSATAISATALPKPANQPNSDNPARETAPVTFRAEGLDALLARFRLDLSAHDYAKDEQRTNNIAFYMVTSKGWQFDEAMLVAAQWVMSNPYPHPRETRFADVRQVAIAGERSVWIRGQDQSRCLHEQLSKPTSHGENHKQNYCQPVLLKSIND